MRKLETALKDRVLRFDGISVVEPELIPKALAAGLCPAQLRVTEVTQDIESFNANVIAADQLRLSTDEAIAIPMDWQLPAEYKNLDLQARVADCFAKRLPTLNYTDEQTNTAIYRLATELEEIEIRGMTQFMRTICYVLDTFRSKNIVWGVGRGSSCACYTLFILGLHVVDCIKYDVPMTEFFHD